MKVVIKRDGRHTDYERNKIFIAIQKANESVDNDDRVNDDQIYNIIASIEARGDETLPVETIQDYIEQKLMEARKYNLAKAYIKYRYTRELVRKSNNIVPAVILQNATLYKCILDKFLCKCYVITIPAYILFKPIILHVNRSSDMYPMQTFSYGYRN